MPRFLNLLRPSLSLFIPIFSVLYGLQSPCAFALELRPGQTHTISNPLPNAHLEEAVTVFTDHQGDDRPITLNVTPLGTIQQTTTQAQAMQAQHFMTPPPANCAVFVDLAIGRAPFILNNAGNISNAASIPINAQTPKNPLAPYYSPAIYLAGHATLNNTGTINGDIQGNYNYAENGLNHLVININGGNINGDVFTTANFGQMPSPNFGTVNFNRGYTTSGYFKGFATIAVQTTDPINVGHAFTADNIVINQGGRINLNAGGILQSAQPINNNGRIAISSGNIHADVTRLGQGQGTVEILQGNVSLNHRLDHQDVIVRDGAALIMNAHGVIQNTQEIQLRGNSRLQLHGGVIAANIADDGAGQLDIEGPFSTSRGYSIRCRTINVNQSLGGGVLNVQSESPVNGFDSLVIFPQGRASFASNITGNQNSTMQNRGDLTHSNGTLTAGALSNSGDGAITIIGGTIVPHIVQSEQANFRMTNGRLNQGISNIGSGNIEIHGGRIDGTITNNHQQSSLIIAGGIFNGHVLNRAGNFIIHGGTFNDRVTHETGRLHLNAEHLRVAQGLINNATMILNRRTVLEGNYTQNAEGVLESTVTNTHQFGKLEVLGTAQIAPSSAIRIHLPHPERINEGDVFEIVSTRSGHLGGVQLQVAENSPYIFNQVATGNSIRLTAVRSYYLSRMASSPNASVVADAIEDLRFVNTTPQFIGLVNYLDNSPRSEINNTLISIAPNHTHGVFYAGLAPVSIAIKKAQMRLDLRRMEIDTVASGYSSGDFFDGNGTYGPIFFMNNLKQSDLINSPGFRAGTEGLGLLADMMVTDCFQLGAGLVYAVTRVRSEFDSGRTHIDSSEAMVYGGVQHENSFLDATAVAAHNRYHMKRDIIPGAFVAYSKHRGFQYSGKLRAGIDLGCDCVVWTPLATIQYTHLHQNKFFERSILTRFNNTQNSHLAQAGAGIKVGILDNTLRYVPEVHVLYLRDLNKPQLQVTSTFTDAGAAFTLLGPATHYKNSINVGGSLSAFLTSDIMVSGNYDYEGKKKFHSHSASLRFRWLF